MLLPQILGMISSSISVFASCSESMAIQVRIFLFSIIWFLVKTSIATRHAVRLTAVASSLELEKLYLRTRPKGQSIQPDHISDPKTRKLLCQYIASSQFFQMNGEVSIDMDDVEIYEKLKVLHGNHNEEKHHYEKLINAYKSEISAEMAFSFPTEEINFTINSHTLPESAFACPTRRLDDDKIMLNFISFARNVNDALDVPTDENITARFVCRMQSNVCTIIALAEEAAVAVSKDVEYIYLQARKYNKPAKDESKDPLCRLNKAEKLRICGSVLNSTFFGDKIKYIPNGELYFDHCEKVKVSFQTDKAKALIGDTPYEEWVMSCPVEPITDEAEYSYFISRAYNSHTAFVYTRDNWTKEMYKIENLSERISVIIDDSIVPLFMKLRIYIEK